MDNIKKHDVSSIIPVKYLIMENLTTLPCFHSVGILLCMGNVCFIKGRIGCKLVSKISAASDITSYFLFVILNPCFT